MNSCFVRCLWGDELIDRHQDRPHEVVECRRRQPQPEPSIFVAFGEENAEMARAAGWDVLIGSDEPVVNLSGQADRKAKLAFGAYPWGVTMYAHKFLAVAEVLRTECDEVVFLDLETAQLQPLPEDFWQVLAAGQPLQCPLYCYHRKRVPTGQHEWPRLVASAPAFYCRSLSAMEDCLRIAMEFPNATEEVHMRVWIDRDMGGWRGVDAYVRAGYQFPYHEQRHGMLVAPLAPLFGNQNLKGWSTMRRHGIKAWEQYVDSVSSG